MKLPLPVCTIAVTVLPCGTPTEAKYEEIMQAINKDALIEKIHGFVTGYLHQHQVCVTVQYEGE